MVPQTVLGKEKKKKKADSSLHPTGTNQSKGAEEWNPSHREKNSTRAKSDRPGQKGLKKNRKAF